MPSKRVPVPIERELHRSLFSMLEIDEGDAEEIEPAPTNRADINHLRSTATLGKLIHYQRRRIGTRPTARLDAGNLCGRSSHRRRCVQPGTTVESKSFRRRCVRL